MTRPGARILAPAHRAASPPSTLATGSAPGPWRNYNGVQIARDVWDLHTDNNHLTRETQWSEQGDEIAGNRHDVLAGSQLDGTAYADGEDHTCGNWTSTGEGNVQIAHHDRMTFGNQGSPWNSAHATPGCSQEDLRATGGDGLFYCFAID